MMNFSAMDYSYHQNDSNESRSSIAPPTQSRLVEEIMIGILIGVSLYLSVAALTYLCRFGQRNVRLTNFLCVAAPIVLLYCCIWFEIEIYGQSVSQELCYIIKGTAVSVATIEKLMIYVILWVRQRTLTTKSNLSPETLKKLYAANNIVLTGMIILPILQVVVLMVQPIHSADGKCVAHEPIAFVTVATPVVYMLYALFQLGLLALVLRPIIVHLKTANERSAQPKLEALVIRLSVCTAVCVLTDIAFVAMAASRQHEVSFIYIPVIHSVNSLINIIALYCSFVDFAKRMFPFTCSPNQTITPSESSSQAERRTSALPTSHVRAID